MMEGAVFRRGWSTKARIGTLLLLMCMIIRTSTLLQSVEEQSCPHGDYLSETGICCNKCPQGFKLLEECHAVGHRSNCTPCPAGEYTDQINFSSTCRRCRRCKKNEVEEKPCERQQNRECRCIEGYYKSKIDSGTYECLKCKVCKDGERQSQKCTSDQNSECECEKDYYRVKSNCLPCESCTTECKRLCGVVPSKIKTTEAPECGNEFLMNRILGVGVAAVVALVLVGLITYVATKRYTKKKLRQASPQPADSESSSEACEILITCQEEVSYNLNSKAVLQSNISDPESSNLPDCVPVEPQTQPVNAHPITVPSLIYTVLDLVPVLQVKQLVRSLGVTDKEIERAEADHRSCQEAHYQMLRAWAERGSHGGGGQNGIPYEPLLLELLDTLRMIHLERAAEQLETKYSIQ
ncbi:tumor necrosis factor receptor superfamily member 1A isoform X2 [Thalassophryne amazonica]|uniref:tumor necrosis factor receptor superfamily member 1A isoform X2 n=1 Tax=Thalassophryne amazonica TaxID=390379 RepID=UPI0014718A90|nr:tumor necrosis factor receptor superfamily member 1A isoform X2 [Thalassophryne amazonica]